MNALINRASGRRRCVRNSGMTLVEVMVATLLVGFGLASFLSAFTAASRTSEASARRISAVHTARRVMEDLRSKPYSHSDLALTSSSPRTYTNGVTVRITQATGFASTKNIELRVDWNNPGQSKPGQVVLWSSVASCIHP